MSARRVAIMILVLLCMASTLSRAEDWRTSDGKVYKKVTIVKSEPDAVTILHSDGGALIPLASLPLDLQKRFDYDPATAKVAADARVKSDANSAKALAIESAEAAKLHQAQDAKDKAEKKRLADLKKKAGHHDGMPTEPDVLEANKHVADDPLQKPRQGAAQ